MCEGLGQSPVIIGLVPSWLVLNLEHSSTACSYSGCVGSSAGQGHWLHLLLGTRVPAEQPCPSLPTGMPMLFWRADSTAGYERSRNLDVLFLLPVAGGAILSGRFIGVLLLPRARIPP